MKNTKELKEKKNENVEKTKKLSTKKEKTPIKETAVKAPIKKQATKEKVSDKKVKKVQKEEILSKDKSSKVKTAEEKKTQPKNIVKKVVKNAKTSKALENKENKVKEIAPEKKTKRKIVKEEKNLSVDKKTKKVQKVKVENKKENVKILKIDNSNNKSKIKVLYVASECQPFIATGGLGDVVGSLPKEISKSGEVDIRVILPLYKSIKENYMDKMEFIGNFTTHLAWRQEYCGIFKLEYEGVVYYFVDNERYFKREKPYGYYDDGERFAYFCKSVVEGLQVINFFPDIIHCNDWQSALVSSYLKTGNWQDERYYKIKNVYTIHNVEYQGIYGMENLSDLFGIDYKYKNFLEYNGDINLTKAAIQFSDKFTTVSESYCDNLKESYCSGGLNYIIIRNDYKLCGIINGIDYDFYSPKTDKYITFNYDIEHLDDKVKNKLALQKELGLKQDKDVPMLAVVSRLVSHKGIGLLMKILDKVLEQDVQFIVVGTGDKWYVDYFNSLKERHGDKVRTFVDRYYTDIARKAYASSDFLLIPSKIEPCGITQMIASRYGAIPIVREVGGLKDSIKDFGCAEGGNGYTFTNYNPNDLYYQISKALEDYKNKPLMKERIKTVMAQDFSWAKSAKKYIDLYKSLV